MPEPEKKLILNLEKLEPGDILLTISNRELSAFFEEHVGCKYHHAQIYLGGSSYIHSYELGVQAANPARDLFELNDDAVALRIKAKDKEKIIQAALNSVRAKIGTQYSMSEARAVLRNPDIDAKEANRQICTRLVAQAFADSGLKLVDNPDYCSTKDLLNSSEVDVINDILREANDAEIKHATAGSPALNKQEEIQNLIFKEARKLSGTDIQTFDQLESYIVNHQDHDEEMTAIIRKSGYYDMWKMEMAKNPQNYDFAVFTSSYPVAQWPSVIDTYLPIAQRHVNSYQLLLKKYDALNKEQPLAYYKAFKELLSNLISQFSAMQKTMMMALAAYPEE